MTGKEKVRFGFDARRRGFFWGEDDNKTAGTVEVPPVFFDAEGVRSGRSRAGKGRRARPVAAADDAGLCATRRFGSDRIETRVRRVARCAPRGPPDNPASHRRHSRVSERWRPRSERCRKRRRGRCAHLDLEDCTLRADLWVREERGDDARSAPGRVRRATRWRATDAGMSASSDEALHRWRCKTRSHPGAGSTPARAFATRHVSRTHLEVTDTLPATRAADMVMADMFVEGCAKVAARSARWNASNTHGLAFLSIKNLEPRSRFR